MFWAFHVQNFPRTIYQHINLEQKVNTKTKEKKGGKDERLKYFIETDPYFQN